MPDLVANSTFKSVQEMQSLTPDSTDEDGLGPFILILGEDKAVVVVWRKNSTKEIDNETVWAASLGRWESISGSGGGDIKGIKADWTPQLFFDGIEVTYQRRVGHSYKVGDIVQIYAEIVFSESVVGVDKIDIDGYPYPRKYPKSPIPVLWEEQTATINGSYIMTTEEEVASSVLALATAQLLSLTTEQLLSLPTN